MYPFKDQECFEYAIVNIDRERSLLKERLEEGSLLLAKKFDRKKNVNAFHRVLD